MSKWLPTEYNARTSQIMDSPCDNKHLKHYWEKELGEEFWKKSENLRKTLNLISKETGMGKTKLKEFRRKLREKGIRVDNLLKGQVPYGWKINDEGIIEEDAYEQKILQLINDLSGEGKSLRGICQELSKQNVSTKNGGKWHPNTVRKIINR